MKSQIFVYMHGHAYVNLYFIFVTILCSLGSQHCKPQLNTILLLTLIIQENIIVYPLELDFLM